MRRSRAFIEHHTQVLRESAGFLSSLGNDGLAPRFDGEADDLAAARTRGELRVIQERVRLHLKGTTGAFTDVMSLNRSDTLTTGGITKHARYFTEHRRFTRRINPTLWWWSAGV